jgi:hypothetical protein
VVGLLRRSLHPSERGWAEPPEKSVHVLETLLAFIFVGEGAVDGRADLDG